MPHAIERRTAIRRNTVKSAVALSWLPLLALVVRAGIAVAAAPEMVEVTTCGQEVPRGAIGYLTADLSCSPTDPSVGVVLGKRAQLDLRGFTLSGGYTAVSCNPPDCGYQPCFTRSSRCTVYGGTIDGAGYAAIAGSIVTIRD